MPLQDKNIERLKYWSFFNSHSTVQWCKIFYCGPEDFGFPKLSSPSSFILDAKPYNVQNTPHLHVCIHFLASDICKTVYIQCVYVLSTTYVYVCNAVQGVSY